MKKIGLLVFLVTITLISAQSWFRQTEILIDTNIIYTRNFDWQDSVIICHGIDNSLLVWQDQRNGIIEIWAARVDTQCNLIDSAGFCLVQNGADPSIAFDGTNYFLVWEQSHIYGARITTDGVIIDTGGIEICSGNNGGDPVVAYDGNNYLVAWDGTYQGIFGVRVATNGQIIDTVANQLVFDDVGESCITFGGSLFLIVYSYFSDIGAVRVNTNGQGLDTVSIYVGSGYHPSVASDGNNFLVCWDDWDDVYGMRIGQNGTLLDSIPIVVCNMDSGQYCPGIHFYGDHYCIVWSDERSMAVTSSIYGTFVDTAGTVLDTSGLLIHESPYEYGFEGFPRVHHNGSNFIVAWTRQEWKYRWDRNIYTARFSITGVVDTIPLLMSQAAYMQIDPITEFGERSYLILWNDLRDDCIPALYAAIIDTTGIIVDSIIHLFDSVFCNNMVFDGTNYLIIFQTLDSVGNPTGMYGARISQDGTILDPDGFEIPGGGGRCPGLDFDGINYLVTWSKYDHWGKVYGARVTTNGVVIDSGGFVIDSTWFWYNESVPSFGDSIYLVVYVDTGALYCKRVHPNGTVIDSIDAAIAQGSLSERHPSVAYHSGIWFVCWEDNLKIYGARVDTALTVLDPGGFQIFPAGGSQCYPHVECDDTCFTVLWSDNFAGDYNVFGVRVSLQGAIVDTFTVCSQDRMQTEPYFAYGPGDQALIVYSGFIDSIGGRVANTRRIWGSLQHDIGIGEHLLLENADRRCILQILPNPMKWTSQIVYYVPIGKKYSLSLYDVVGREVIMFDTGISKTGNYTQTLYTRDFSQGIYFLRLEVDDINTVQKLVIIR